MSTFHNVVRAELNGGATMNQALDHAAHVEQLHRPTPTGMGSGSGAPTAPVSLATGLLIWGLIAMMGNGEIASYLIGAAVLLYALQTIIWIIYHPIRAFVGFLLLCGLVWYAFTHLGGKPNATSTPIVRKR